jgi:hypothetical protein
MPATQPIDVRNAPLRCVAPLILLASACASPAETGKKECGTKTDVEHQMERDVLKAFRPPIGQKKFLEMKSVKVSDLADSKIHEIEEASRFNSDQKFSEDVRTVRRYFERRKGTDSSSVPIGLLPLALKFQHQYSFAYIDDYKDPSDVYINDITFIPINVSSKQQYAKVAESIKDKNKIGGKILLDTSLPECAVAAYYNEYEVKNVIVLIDKDWQLSAPYRPERPRDLGVKACHERSLAIASGLWGLDSAWFANVKAERSAQALLSKIRSILLSPSPESELEKMALNNIECEIMKSDKRKV